MQELMYLAVKLSKIENTLLFLCHGNQAVLFAANYRNRDLFKPSEKYFIENNPDLPILETLSFLLSEVDVKFTICQNVTKELEQNQIPIILDQFHNAKATFTAELMKLLGEYDKNIIGPASLEM